MKAEFKAVTSDQWRVTRGIALLFLLVTCHSALVTSTSAQTYFRAAPNTLTTAVTPTQGVKAVAAAGTPVKMVTAVTLVESVEIYARKAPGTANTGNVYVGFSSTGGQNYRVLAPDGSFSLSAPWGKKIDLSKIYIDAATNADAVVYTAVN